jgi:hypothetical protein
MDEFIDIEVTQTEFLQLQNVAKEKGFDDIDSYLDENFKCRQRLELADKLGKIIQKKNLSRKEFDVFRLLSADYFDNLSTAKLHFNREIFFVLKVSETILKYLIKY